MTNERLGTCRTSASNGFGHSGGVQHLKRNDCHNWTPISDPGLTPTNWEDNQLMADAAQKQLQAQKRARGIDDAVRRGMHKIITELMDDYKLTASDAITVIRKHLS